MVSWTSIEVEYIAPTYASKEAVRLQQLGTEIGFEQQTIRLECDTQSAIFLVKNLTYHSNTKHIDV